MSSWIGVGFWMMFLIGGLKDIPRDLYEASAIDGANAVTSLWRITIPLMRRPLAFVVVADTVAAFLLFAPIALLTRGGPNNLTKPIVLYIYETAFRRWDLGLGAAASEILFILILIAAMAQYLVSRRKGAE